MLLVPIFQRRDLEKLSISYTNFFNKKYKRVGSLFQGPFKASVLAYEKSLERTSAYVNINYKHHKYDPKTDLVKTSLFEFLGTEKGNKICSLKEIDFIISESDGIEKYKKDLKEYGKIFLIEKKEKEFEK